MCLRIGAEYYSTEQGRDSVTSIVYNKVNHLWLHRVPVIAVYVEKSTEYVLCFLYIDSTFHARTFVLATPELMSYIPRVYFVYEIHL